MDSKRFPQDRRKISGPARATWATIQAYLRASILLFSTQISRETGSDCYNMGLNWMVSCGAVMKRTTYLIQPILNWSPHLFLTALGNGSGHQVCVGKPESLQRKYVISN
jgi:hypothetical protein